MRNDGDEYCKPLRWRMWFPKNKDAAYGPMQVEAQIQIRNSLRIAKEFSSRNLIRTTYKRGDMFIIPVNNL